MKQLLLILPILLLTSCALNPNYYISFNGETHKAYSYWMTEEWCVNFYDMDHIKHIICWDYKIFKANN